MVKNRYILCFTVFVIKIYKGEKNTFSTNEYFYFCKRENVECKYIVKLK